MTECGPAGPVAPVAPCDPLGPFGGHVLEPIVEVAPLYTHEVASQVNASIVLAPATTPIDPIWYDTPPVIVTLLPKATMAFPTTFTPPEICTPSNDPPMTATAT